MLAKIASRRARFVLRHNLKSWFTFQRLDRIWYLVTNGLSVFEMDGERGPVSLGTRGMWYMPVALVQILSLMAGLVKISSFLSKHLLSFYQSLA